MVRSNLIILTVGLGAIPDNVIKETLARILKRNFLLHEPVLNKITRLFAGDNQPMSINNTKQVYFIEGSKIIPNDIGTAPGLLIRAEGSVINLIPGPP